MFTSILIVHTLICLLIIFVVLLQTGRGAELGAAFGSMGQATFSRGRLTFISKFTWGLAVLFACTSVGLTLLSSQQHKGSILSPDVQPSEAMPVQGFPGQPAAPGQPAPSALPQTQAPASPLAPQAAPAPVQ
ncbi:MAG: preprotein translocase subunit SecG [Deltaproteobacteria bacterium]|nr:preprotein translocase subunit SecG [Deltaproteobacteria bacterium]